MWAVFPKALAAVVCPFLDCETFPQRMALATLGDGVAGTAAYCRRMTFSFESTTDDVLDGIDLSGRRFVITGAASGLGEESTRALAAHGASILLLARDPQKNADAAERVLDALLESLPASEAAKLAARITGAPRNALYKRALQRGK